MKAESGGLSSLKTASFTFESMDGSNSKLVPTITTKSWIYENGYFYKLNEDWDDIPFNPEFWKLTKADGSEYIISTQTGLVQYTDTNGNMVVFYTNGIAGEGKRENAILYNFDDNHRMRRKSFKEYLR